MKIKFMILVLLPITVLFAEINQYQSALDKIRLVKDPSFTGVNGTVLKSKTPYILDALRDIEDAPQEVRQQAMSILQPTETFEEIYDTPEGHFRIHYETSGINSADWDYIERMGECFEYAWDLIIDSLGYFPPPPDDGYGGADNYDVYVRNFGAYGATTPLEEGPYEWEDRTSYIEIENDFVGGYPPNDDPEGPPWGQLKVTTAHEFFHAVQLGYRGSIADAWILEIGATWMEDVGWNDVNDYINYVDNYYGEPHVSLTTETMHMYGSCIFFHFFETKFGIDIMKNIWENARYEDNYIICIEDALAEFETTLEYEFADFTYFNWFTKGADFRLYSEDANRWDSVYVENTETGYPASGNLSRRPNYLGCSYIVFEGIDRSEDGFLINIYGSTSTDWRLRTILELADNTYMLNRSEIPSTGEATIYIDDLSNIERVIVIPSAVDGRPGESWVNYSLSYAADYATDTAAVEFFPIENIDEEIILPEDLTMIAYPNPFNSSCTIELNSKQDSNFNRLQVFDFGGRLLEEFPLQIGQNRITWQAEEAPSGVYLYRVINDNSQVGGMGKMILQK